MLGSEPSCDASAGSETTASTAARTATSEATAALAPGAVSWKNPVASREAVRATAGFPKRSSSVSGAVRGSKEPQTLWPPRGKQVSLARQLGASPRALIG